MIGITELAAIVGFTLLVGLLAGSYPSLILSSFKPAVTLKGKLQGTGKGKSLRNVLVVLQFTISCTLITATFLFQRQVNFLQQTKLGFDKENVILVNNADQIQDQEAFQTQLSQVQGIVSVSYSTSGPIGDYDGTQIGDPTKEDQYQIVNINRADDMFLPTMKRDCISGRNFSRDLARDSSAVILNKTAADMLFGSTETGGQLAFKGGTRRYDVVGVIEDFNFESLRKEVMPLVIFHRAGGSTMEIRISEGNYQQTLDNISSFWATRAPDVPFTYSFVDQQYDALYTSERQTGLLISAFAVIAIIIACLGLFGLAAYMAEQRTKEIGIRKTLGASVPSILVMLSKDFVKVISIGFILSLPLAYYLIEGWLENFAYKISPGFLAFTVGGIIAMVLAVLTISLQSAKAANLNPVDTLKNE